MCIRDSIRAALGSEGFKAHCAGCVIKYVWRYRHKGGLDDVRKAYDYLGWLLEELELDERAEAEMAQEEAAASAHRRDCYAATPSEGARPPMSARIFGRSEE